MMAWLTTPPGPAHQGRVLLNRAQAWRKVNSGWAGSLAEGAIRSRLTPTAISVLVARASNATSSKSAAVNDARTRGVRSWPG
jgi:hypothetical protein